MITIGEQMQSNDSGVCEANHLRFIRVMVPLLIVAIVTSLAYMKTIARNLSSAGENI